MRVNLRKNVFSHTTAVVMMNMCKYERKSTDGKLEMSKEGEDTALLLYLIDKIFDSVNCDEKPKSKKNNAEEGEEENEEEREKSRQDYNYKQYIATSDDCPHEVLWNDAIRLFDSMKYVKNNPKDKERPNVLKNFAHTLRGLQILRKKMKEHGSTHFSGRMFNQDPVENFFGQIRQHGIHNTKPTTIAVTDYYKSILVYNIVKNNIKDTNCENDSSLGFLVTVKTLLNHNKNNDLREKSWTLPAFPINFDYSKDFSDSSENIFQHIITKDILSVSEVDCFICEQNLLLTCERKDCVPNCDKSNLKHSILHVANVTLYFLPLHGKKILTKKAREFYMLIEREQTVL